MIHAEGCFGSGLNQRPSHRFFELAEALWADPAIVVGDVPSLSVPGGLIP